MDETRTHTRDFVRGDRCAHTAAAKRNSAINLPRGDLRLVDWPERSSWEGSNERVQPLVTGRGVDLGWFRPSHFQRGVVFRNPVFDFNVKLFHLDDDLFCFCVGRNIGESVVDSISFPSTRLKIVGVLVRGFTQHQLGALQGHPVVSDFAHDPIPAQAMAVFAAWSAALYAVANLRSAERPARLASARSRAIKARILSNSFLEVLCFWASLFANKLVQVTLASFHKLFPSA